MQPLGPRTSRASVRREVDPSPGRAAAPAPPPGRVAVAADEGSRDADELELLRFPAAWCSDHGRAINNLEPDWPRTLVGYARNVHDAFADHLAPLGYRMSA